MINKAEFFEGVGQSEAEGASIPGNPVSDPVEMEAEFRFQREVMNKPAMIPLFALFCRFNIGKFYLMKTKKLQDYGKGKIGGPARNLPDDWNK